MAKHEWQRQKSEEAGKNQRMKVLVTGGAGFIGSHLADALANDKRIREVRILDNLATGAIKNIQHLQGLPHVKFIEGDIRNFNTCVDATKGVDFITHQAALGSVPRSVKDPLTSNEVNVTGTLNIFTAAKDNGVRRVVYASSSSAYGDHPALPKKEDITGKPLSPYAVTKYTNELYANTFASLFEMEMIGLRYFNIFGPRQNPKGPYAAVIPLFIHSIIQGEAPHINGDGNHSRDFTYVQNAVHANILALFSEKKESLNQAYNIACGKQTTLNELFSELKKIAGSDLKANHGPERPGDVKHSYADISKASSLLGYSPAVSLEQGLLKTFEWYRQHLPASVS